MCNSVLSYFKDKTLYKYCIFTMMEKYKLGLIKTCITSVLVYLKHSFYENIMSYITSQIYNAYKILVETTMDSITCYAYVGSLQIRYKVSVRWRESYPNGQHILLTA